MAEALLLQKVRGLLPFVQSALQAGLGLQAAIAHGNDRRLPLAFADFVVKPSAHTLAIPPRDQAMALFVNDFQRQGEHEASRTAAGAMSITVTDAKGGVTTVRNGSAGFTEAELADFNRSKVTSRHRAVERALEQFCGENARQCDAAIAMLGQGGSISFLRMFGTLVEGAGGMEHSAANYQFARRDNGDVVLAMATAAGDGAARLEATVVIHPDGSHELANFSLEPPKVRTGEAARGS